jgi:hypothetical protein
MKNSRVHLYMLRGHKSLPYNFNLLCKKIKFNGKNKAFKIYFLSFLFTSTTKNINFFTAKKDRRPSRGVEVV